MPFLPSLCMIMSHFEFVEQDNNRNGHDRNSKDEDGEALPLPSAESGPSTSTTQSSISDKERTPGKTNRKSCPYGQICYRKNPQHKSDEAHPGDDDYQVQL